MLKIRTETHKERFVNWRVVMPYIIFLFSLPAVIAFSTLSKLYLIIPLILILVGTGFWISDKWIYSSKLLIINRKDLGNGKSKVEISGEDEFQAATYIVTKDENGKIGLEGPK